MFTTTTTYDAVDAITYGATFTIARNSDARIADSTSEWSHASGTRYYLAADHASGFAIRADGELVLVFSTVRGRGDELVRTAVELGADRLDCFAGYLVDLYGRHGFATVEVEPNWSGAHLPAVHYMRTVSGMIADGWTVDSAYNHRDGACDYYVCPAAHV